MHKMLQDQEGALTDEGNELMHKWVGAIDQLYMADNVLQHVADPETLSVDLWTALLDAKDHVHPQLLDTVGASGCVRIQFGRKI